MTKKKLYSSNQALVIGFFSGPLTLIYFIYKNFKVLEETSLARKAVIFGIIFIFMMVLLSPLLKSNVFNFFISIFPAISARYIIKNFQFNKQDITDSEELSFYSNWRALLAGIIGLIMFFIVAFVIYLPMGSLLAQAP
ncbi:hypothetical protein ABFY09_10550 [Marinomonas sp. 5E14-1]|uniref:hypothetical protein n=1 Tax=Marinomonas sp. 5E14-1 TaxID=3153922 RepID=UPI0032675858